MGYVVGYDCGHGFFMIIIILINVWRFSHVRYYLKHYYKTDDRKRVYIYQKYK